MPHESSLRDQLGRLPSLLDGSVPNGDLAELRRMAWGSPPGMAFWKLVFRAKLDGRVNPDNEARWVALTQALSETRGLHDASEHLGSALAHAGLSELRLQRLLRADDNRFLDELRAVGRFLAAKGARFDARELGMVVLMSDDENDPSRRRVARDYFRALYSMSTDA